MEPRPHERGNSTCRRGNRSIRRSFNGATSSRTWKPRRIIREKKLALRASMEPRPHERGNVPFNTDAGFLYDGASMEPRPHERGNRLGPPHSRAAKRGFNGATSSRRWKNAAKHVA